MKYCLKPDIPDERDLLFKSTTSKFTKPIANSYDVRKFTKTPAILNQGDLGTCAANQLSNAVKECLGNTWQPSRLYIYYYGRLVDKSDLKSDTGMSIRGGVKSIAKYGVCDEAKWPYHLDKFTEKPNQYSTSAAAWHIGKGFKYYRVEQDLYSICQALLTNNCVVFGLQIYESFESKETATTGLVKTPVPGERKLGGHALSLWGYDLSSKLFLAANSWGTEFGDKGYLKIPFDYVLDNRLGMDFWCLQNFV